MRLRDNIMIAWQNLRHEKGRTMLCVLAVAIGICAVCTIRGLGSCATRLISEELGTIGIHGTTFYIDGPGSFVEDAVEQVSVFPQVNGVSPLVVRTGYITVRDKRFANAICGVNQEISNIFALKLIYGRALSITDIKEKARVIILDAGTAERSYGRKNIVGKTVEVKIGKITDKFTVVGIIEAQQSGLESLFGETLPGVSYAPHTTLDEMKLIEPTMMAVSFYQKNQDAEHVRVKISEVLQAKTTMHTNVRFQNLDSYEDSFLKVSDTIAWFATGVAAISAVVAGIGVMNTMLSAIDARTHEIGVYIALGARKRDLIRNFFLETCLTCLLGGFIGAFLYIGFFIVLQQFLAPVIKIQIIQIFFGIGVALVCGVIFGIVPAIKVSEKKPIEILKAD